jgi:SAM-dependent methyltransferase
LKCHNSIMTEHRNESEEQAALWNGPAGRAWVDEQELLDRVLRPFEELLVDAAASARVGVLDVGCGTGSTTLAFARAGARCVGVDISEPMIRAARARAGGVVDFLRADAQTHAFDAGSFDRILSRFGVMFFGDPVRAFANLRRAATPDGELRFVAWRSAAENPFMTAAERAAAPLLPELPPRKPDAPGQFAFADRGRIEAILGESGWLDVDIRPLDVECALPEPDLLRYITRLGPVGRVLDAVDEPTRARVTSTVRAAFEPFVHGREVRFTAACWDVAARSR